MTIYRHLILGLGILALTSHPLTASAQSDEFGVDFSLDVQKKFSKQWSIDLEAEYRDRNNLKTNDRWSIGLGLDYKVAKWLKASAGYTFIYDKEHQKYVDDIASRRKTMVSTGDRSAKIRTYNYPQGRITDHRIGYTIYNLAAFMDGDIQDCIDHLIVAENAERMKEAEL